ncbi:MAG: class I SAM-dependent methyltransferase [Anaerolineales bacterium]
MTEVQGWEDYYQKIKGRAPRQLLLDALTYFADGSGNVQRLVIDLGCGDGTESAILLERGWNVLAIDGEPASIQHLLAKVPAERLQTQVTKFEQVSLPPADLIHASLSLPFCPPEHFDALWAKIAAAVKPGGRFAGQFFGVRDSWVNEPDMTFHTEEQVRRLLGDFEIEHFDEMDKDGPAVSGPKHWHVFTVIARKN